MRPWLRFRLLLIGLALGLVFGCESIAGIEDRVYDPAGQVSPACRRYCDTVMANCTGAYQVYTTDQTCLAVCAELDPGDPLEPVGNTVACRTNQAVLAGTTEEPAQHCPRAGPGGNGVCGGDCDSYCLLFAQVCTAEIPDQDECVAKCAAFEDEPSFDVVANYTGDTVQCRLVHLSSAAAVVGEHCAHSRFNAEKCTAPLEAPPECDDYCRRVMVACSGEFAQYESTAQCLAVCGALPPGLNQDRVENTVGCRKYHSFNSMLDPASHCSHAGPAGDGHCGSPAEPETGFTGNCEAYCTLLEAVCSPEFGAEFASQAECIESCLPVDGAGPDSKYSVENAAAGPTLECRFLALARASDDPSTCAAALGGPGCQ